jgi:hypothetical protein
MVKKGIGRVMGYCGNPVVQTHGGAALMGCFVITRRSLACDLEGGRWKKKEESFCFIVWFVCCVGISWPSFYRH